jgi:hypothetical protein
MTVYRIRRAFLSLGAVLLLLNAGNCVLPLFESQEAKDCCTRGKCTPKTGDDCCRSAIGAIAGKHFEQGSRSSIDPPTLECGVVAALDVQAPDAVNPRITFVPSFLSEHAPPGGEPLNTNLPLLI